MFEVIKEPRNQITVREYIMDRDGDEVCHFDIGIGFGIIKKRKAADIEADTDNRNASESVLLHYEPTGMQSALVGDAEYTAVYNEPFIASGQRECRLYWRGNEYIVTKVGYYYDIHGSFVGYRLWCSNENVKFY